MEELLKRDIICCVLAHERSPQIIYKVLNNFIPFYEKLNGDYVHPNNDPFYQFKNEEEIVNYFSENKSEETTLFWNQYYDNPDKIMGGAFFTSDGMLIMSLTVNPITKTEQEYLKELKKFLDSKIGVINYINPPEFENGHDFIAKYS
ncbi:MAG: hypothetical protein ACXWEY_16525 [Bacteroidia bacterium]